MKRTALGLVAGLIVCLLFSAGGVYLFKVFPLCSQAGKHLLLFVVPFVHQYSRGLPYMQARHRIHTEYQLYMKMYLYNEALLGQGRTQAQADEIIKTVLRESAGEYRQLEYRGR